MKNFQLPNLELKNLMRYSGLMVILLVAVLYFMLGNSISKSINHRESTNTQN